MMQYKYRWLYALGLSFITILVGYFYDLEKKYTHFVQLEKNENNFIERLAHKSTFNQDRNNHSKSVLSSFKKDELLLVSNIVTLAHITGLSIQSIKSTNRSFTNFFSLQISAEGYFKQTFSFIEALEKMSEMKLNYFSCRLGDQLLLHIEAEIEFPYASMQQELPKIRSPDLLITNNPFCAKTVNNEWHDYSLHEWQSFPLSLIKMVGYLKQGKRIQALLLLPNNDLVAIEQGSILGKEQARVTAIQPDRIQVKWQAKSQVIFLHFA